MSRYEIGALYALGVLDVAPEEPFDDLARMAAGVAGGVRAEVLFADGTRLVRKAEAGAPEGSARVPAGDAPERDEERIAICLRDGTEVGVLAVHAPADAITDAERELLSGIARQAGALLDERRAASWQEGANTPIGVTIVDAEGRLLSANPRLEELFGWTEAEIVGESVLELIHPDDLEPALLAFERTGRHPGQKAPFDLRMRTRDGSYVPVEVTADNRLDDPLVGGIVFTVRDQRRRSRTENLLSREAAVLQMIARSRSVDELLVEITRILDSLVDFGYGCVMLADPGDATISPAAAPSLPHAFVETLAHMPIGPSSASCGTCMHRVQAAITPDITTDPAWRGRRADTEVHGIVACWSLPVIDSHTNSAIGTVAVYRTERGRPTLAEAQVMDVCSNLVATAVERSRVATEMSFRATHDALTGLPNRATFLERLREHLGRPDPDMTPSVFFLDLDRFKVINDGLGHEVGDRVLCAVADRLATALDEPAFVARFGGDEFTCIIPDTVDAEDALRRADALLTVFSEPITLEDRELYLNGSIGIAMARTDTTDPAALLQEADTARLRAKERGRASLFDDEMRARAVDRLLVEHGLRGALRDDELVVHFQTQFSAVGGRLTGAEALVRWAHPAWGLVEPMRFIPIAEETGLIHRVSEVVLRAACDLVHELSSGEYAVEVPVWVNLSASQLLQPGLVDWVEEALEACAVAPERIGFEITEVAIMPDVDTCLGVLHKLKELGVHLGIDDFGTGYSSLSYLQRLPVDVLKLDQSFVANLGRDPEQDAIAAAVFSLARTLRMTSLAEGVETPEQLERLVELGCDEVQGYLLARPLPAQDVLAAIRDEL